MTAPANLPIVGKVSIRETSKEALLDFSRGIEHDTGLAITCKQSVSAIETVDEGFVVVAGSERPDCACVLLESNVQGIAPDSITIHTAESAVTLPNDDVIISAGGILPTGFLQSIVAEAETRHGTA